MPYTYDYPRPMLTVDAIIYKINNNSETELLLIKRRNAPFKDKWALPGGFVDSNEDLIDAVKRETYEETNLKDLKFMQFKAFGTPGRDPRGHTVSVVFYADITNTNQTVKAGDDAKEYNWFSLKNLPDLAFDHHEIIKDWILFINLKNV